MKVYRACGLVICLFLLHASFCRAGGLTILQPQPGQVFYLEESVPLRAVWTGVGDSSAAGLSFVWSSDAGGQVAQSLEGSLRNPGYRVHNLTLTAQRGDSVLALARVSFTVIVRPVQFTLSERTDWDGEVSRSGAMVAFTSFRNGDPEVWTSTIAAKGVTRITYQGGWGPSWTLDGRRLVFWSERAGKRDLWLLELGREQLNARRLTPNTGADWQPACSPVDNRVAFSSKRGSRLSVKVLDLDNPDQEPVEVIGPEQHPMFPRWFPGGKELLFTSYSDTLPAVCRVSLADGGVSRITAGAGAEDADVSPDGARIVMVRGGDLWLRRLSDGSERPLTRDHAGALSPRFLTDGNRVLFASTYSGNYDLWLLDLPAGN
jgi:hypothetical protein